MYLYSIKFISEIEKNNLILKNYDNRKKAKFYMDVLKAEQNMKNTQKNSQNSVFRKKQISYIMYRYVGDKKWGKK